MVEIKDEFGKVIARVTDANPNVNGCEEGVWCEIQAADGSKPTLCLIKDKEDGTFDGDWYIGAYRDSKNAPFGCDLAIRFTQQGPTLQVIKGKDVKILNLFDLLSTIENQNVAKVESKALEVKAENKVDVSAAAAGYPQINKPPT